MAKTISAALLSAQQSLNRKPYTRAVFTSKDEGTTYDYSFDPSVTTNRFFHIEHYILVYDDYATIVLMNEDNAVPDLRGYYVDVGYGYDTSGDGGSGNEKSDTPRLWVYSQHHVSAPGQEIVILLLEGIWRRMARKLVDVEATLPLIYHLPGNYRTFNTLTIYGLIQYLVVTIYGYTLQALGTEDDGIVDNLPVEFNINVSAFDYMNSMLMRLVAMTKTYLIATPNKQFKVVYPEIGDAVDFTYYSDQIPEFLEYTERKSVLLPNHIIVYGNYVEPTLENGLVTGWENIITSEVSEVGTDEEDVLEIQVAQGIRSQGALDDFRDSLMQKAKAQTVSGRMTGPMDIRVELIDRLEILDSRNL
ncbi:hypothetical protein LCGC14_1378470 [marine sediment metagenome]|uniref:Uncharacterized protein n=1 Tax=marine sediment metagenome TaxID=412755 RepID=A0A0F9KPA6_9ZZZZ